MNSKIVMKKTDFSQRALKYQKALNECDDTGLFMKKNS